MLLRILVVTYLFSAGCAEKKKDPEPTTASLSGCEIQGDIFDSSVELAGLLDTSDSFVVAGSFCEKGRLSPLLRRFDKDGELIDSFSTIEDLTEMGVLGLLQTRSGNMIIALSGKNSNGWEIHSKKESDPEWSITDEREKSSIQGMFQGKGALFVFGSQKLEKQQTGALIRRSLDEGQSWETAYETGPEGFAATVTSMTECPGSGRLFASHLISSDSGSEKSVILRSDDQGRTWQEDETFSYNSKFPTRVTGLFCTADDSVYAVGGFDSEIDKTPFRAAFFKKYDQNSWEDLETYAFSLTPPDSSAQSVGADAEGQIHYLVRGYSGVQGSHRNFLYTRKNSWVIRSKQEDSFENTDVYQFHYGNNTFPSKLLLTEKKQFLALGSESSPRIPNSTEPKKARGLVRALSDTGWKTLLTVGPRENQ